MQSVGKAREAGALHGGRQPSRWTDIPEVPRVHDRKVVGAQATRGVVRGEKPLTGSGGGRASEVRSPREHAVPVRTKPPGTTRETAHPWGETAEAPTSGRWGLTRKRRSGEVGGNPFRVTGGRKALKGEAHERWRLKDASKDRRVHAVERVAKPYGRNLLGAWQSSQDASKEAKKGILFSGHAEGSGASGEVPGFWA